MILEPFAGVRAPGGHGQPVPSGPGDGGLDQVSAEAPAAELFGNPRVHEDEPPAIELVLQFAPCCPRPRRRNGDGRRRRRPLARIAVASCGPPGSRLPTHPSPASAPGWGRALPQPDGGRRAPAGRRRGSHCAAPGHSPARRRGSLCTAPGQALYGRTMTFQHSAVGGCAAGGGVRLAHPAGCPHPAPATLAARLGRPGSRFAPGRARRAGPARRRSNGWPSTSRTTTTPRTGSRTC